MQHRSPQVLSPSSFPTSACPGASMDAERRPNRRRRRSARPEHTLGSAARGAGPGCSNRPRTFPPGRRRGRKSAPPRRGFASFYGSLGARRALAVKRAASGARCGEDGPVCTPAALPLRSGCSRRPPPAGEPAWSGWGTREASVETGAFLPVTAVGKRPCGHDPALVRKERVCRGDGLS